MSAGSPIVSLVVLLPSLAIAGCFASDDGHYAVGYPAPGAAASYRALYVKDDRESWANISVEGEGVVSRGDGEVVEALVLRRGESGARFVEKSSRNLVRTETPSGANFKVNLGDQLFSNHFWGRSFREGQSWTGYLGTPANLMNFTVTKATGGELEIWNYRPDARVFSYTPNDVPTSNAYRFSWTGSPLFADRVEVYQGLDASPDALLSVFTLVDQHPVRQAAPRIESSHWTFESSTWSIFPPMDWAKFGLPYREFVDYAMGKEAVRDYLESHPDAFVSYVAYRQVTEEESFANVWYAFLRDGSDDAIVVSLSRRCFSNEAYIVLYGPCRDDPSYYGAEEPKPNFVSTKPNWTKPSAVSLESVVPALQTIASGVNFTSVEWFAFPQHSEREVSDGPPGWLLRAGPLNGEVEYLHPDGPRGTGMSGETTLTIQVDGLTGWVIQG